MFTKVLREINAVQGTHRSRCHYSSRDCLLRLYFHFLHPPVTATWDLARSKPVLTAFWLYPWQSASVVARTKGRKTDTHEGTASCFVGFQPAIPEPAGALHARHFDPQRRIQELFLDYLTADLSNTTAELSLPPLDAIEFAIRDCEVSSTQTKKAQHISIDQTSP